MKSIYRGAVTLITDWWLLDFSFCNV